MPANIIVPELGESIVDARVARWLKKEGDRVAAGDPLVELETDKIDLEVSAPQAGVLGRIDRPDGQDVKIGEVLGVVLDAPAERAGTPRPAATAEAEPAASPAPVSATASAAGARATPTARRLARQHQVDVSQVPSGDGDRVTASDVRGYLEHRPAEARPAPAEEIPTGSLVTAPRVEAGEAGRPEERVHMSRRRLTIARRLVEAQQTSAMLTTFNEIDMSAVMALRARHKEAFQARHGVSLGIASFFVKASIGALSAFPRLNAEIQGEEMVLKHYYDIGVAVGASEGLVVPVLRDADKMSFAEIEQKIRAFARQAEDGTLSLADLRGGTFTITNGGVFGSLLSTPILNPPQVGILGLHKIEERPIVVTGQIAVRPMMYVALTYDHRIVDGAEAVRFLVKMKALVEDPGALLLEA